MKKTYNDAQVENLIIIVRNLLKQQLNFAPSHGSIGIEIIFRDGEPARIVSKNELSTMIGPSSSNKIEGNIM